MVASDAALLEEYKKLGTPKQIRYALKFKAEPNIPLLEEFNFYLKNQEAFIPVYNGRVIVIKGKKVIGAYDDDLEAINKTIRIHPLGTFLVQRVSPGKADFTVTLSRCTL